MEAWTDPATNRIDEIVELDAYERDGILVLELRSLGRAEIITPPSPLVEASPHLASSIRSHNPDRRGAAEACANRMGGESDR